MRNAHAGQSMMAQRRISDLFAVATGVAGRFTVAVGHFGQRLEAQEAVVASLACVYTVHDAQSENDTPDRYPGMAAGPQDVEWGRHRGACRRELAACVAVAAFAVAILRHLEMTWSAMGVRSGVGWPGCGAAL